MRNHIISFINTHVKKKQYWLPLLLFSLLGFGFSLTRNTIGVDDLAAEYYGGITGLSIRGGRWGMYLYNLLAGTSGFSPYIYKFLGFIFLIAASIVLSSIFYFFDKKIKTYVFTIVSSSFVAFPLMFEIWEYSGVNMMVPINSLIVFSSVLFLLVSTRKFWFKTIICSVPLSLVAASYESGLFMYVTLVLCVTFYKFFIVEEKSQKIYSWILFGLKFCPALIMSVFIKFFIWGILLLVLGLTPEIMGDVTMNISINNIQNIASQIIGPYFLSIEYFPILIFVLSFFAFFIYSIAVAALKRKPIALVLFVFIFLSLFFVSFLSGKKMPYRTSLPIQFFVSFVAFIVLRKTSEISLKPIRIGSFVVATMLVLFQSAYLSQLFELNNLNSENELAVVRNLGQELESKYDRKTIVFTGCLHYGSYIEDKIIFGSDTSRTFHSFYSELAEYTGMTDLKIEQTIVPVINWSNLSNTGDINMMEKLFAYCGYDFDIYSYSKTSFDDFYTYWDIAKKENMRPLETKDMGNYILVYLGPKYTRGTPLWH